jgi:tetratricopeptide (TPR) repeat protein
MRTSHSFATAVCPRQAKCGSRVVAFGVTLMVVAGCSGAPAPMASGSAGVAAPGNQITAVQPPRAAQRLDDAVAGLTDALLAKADATRAARRPLVIDPLIDRATSAETTATRSIAAGIATRVRERYPQLELRPFSVASLDQQPLVVLGSIASAASPGSTTAAIGPPRVYRIWAVLADLRTNRVLTREMAWVRAEDVDQTPTALFRDSPTWVADPIVAAYIRTCSSVGGTAIDPTYLQALRAQALIADATAAYEAGRYHNALASYDDALREKGGEQLRALNGRYLSYWALGQRREAEAAFGQVVDFGLARGQLAVKFLFRPGSSAFWPDPGVSGPYPMWLRQIAAQADDRAACLAVQGHASITGLAALNERLSLARAQRVRAQLVAERPPLRDRVSTEGFGSRQPIVGSGTDDAADALDRRVEFKPLPCGVAGATPEFRAPGAG